MRSLTVLEKFHARLPIDAQIDDAVVNYNSTKAIARAINNPLLKTKTDKKETFHVDQVEMMAVHLSSDGSFVLAILFDAKSATAAESSKHGDRLNKFRLELCAGMPV